MEPLISVIVPAFNRHNLILETLDSVYDQSFKNIELIIVDDGSTDQTANVVRSWLQNKHKRFSNVVFEIFTQNRGKSEAVNFGFSVFKGDYVMILDSDDILIKDAFENEVGFFNDHPETDALFAGSFIINTTGKHDKPFHPFKEIDVFSDINEYYGDLLLKGNAIVSSTVLLKKKVIKSIGEFRSDLRYTHDWDYWIRVARKFRFGYINIPVLYYRTEHERTSSSNYVGTYHEIIQLLNKQKHSYKKREILSAFFTHTKYYMWLSKNHNEYCQMIKIGLMGIANSFRFII